MTDYSTTSPTTTWKAESDMIPWKQNCPHIGIGWCIECVSRLGDAIEMYRSNDGSRGKYDALALDRASLAIDAALVSCDPSDIPSKDYQ